MTVFMIAFTVYLLYVSYCKIVCLAFRGRVHNRFFTALISTVIPVFGSIPAYIMVTKYERRVGGLAPKMNGEALRFSVIAVQMLSVFSMFLPFLKKDGIYAEGVNFVYGLNVAGESLIPNFGFFGFLFVVPFISAIINCVDIKFNIRNVITYISSLVCCLTVLAFSVFFYLAEGYSMEYGLWIYCSIQVTVMLLSILSLVKVRNEYLYDLEELEKEELIERQKKKAIKPVEESIPDDSYKCAKCGQLVKKGTICSCRSQNSPNLNSVMVEQNKKETSDFCVYCRRALKPGEKCTCVGDGFGITVKPEQFNGRKCNFCGKLLVGDSLCVCEKIMKNSAPASDDADAKEPKPYFAVKEDTSTMGVSDEMAQLEELISKKFANIKDSLEKKGAINADEKRRDDVSDFAPKIESVDGDPLITGDKKENN